MALLTSTPTPKKVRKVFLCLFVSDGGIPGAQKLLKGLEGEDAGARFEKKSWQESQRKKSGKQTVANGGRDWILRKDVRRSHLPVLFLPSLNTFDTVISG